MSTTITWATKDSREASVTVEIKRDIDAITGRNYGLMISVVGYLAGSEVGHTMHKRTDLPTGYAGTIGRLAIPTDKWAAIEAAVEELRNDADYVADNARRQKAGTESDADHARRRRIERTMAYGEG